MSAVTVKCGRRSAVFLFVEENTVIHIIIIETNYQRCASRLGQFCKQQVAMAYNCSPVMLRLSNQHQLQADSSQPFSTCCTICPEKRPHGLQHAATNKEITDDHLTKNTNCAFMFTATDLCKFLVLSLLNQSSSIMHCVWLSTSSIISTMAQCRGIAC